MSDAADQALVRGLVEIPSLSGEEGAAVRWLVDRMAERGFRASVDPAGNAVGEIGSGDRHVVLLGHIDTVPGLIPVRVEDGELVGRGAVDAKGPLAAFVAAATEPPAGLRITVVGAVEEESPSSAGARHRATTEAPDWCVVGEPSGWDGVTVGYKGRLLLDLTLERDARHGAAPGPTVSEEALALWVAIRDDASARHPGTGFASLDCRLEGIAGGAHDGLVERATMRIGYRLPPGLDPAALADQVRQIVARSPGPTRRSVVPRGAEVAVRTPRTSPLAGAFARAIAGAGGQVTFKTKSGTSDLNVLSPAWGCPMVAYGPGDAAYDHTPIERLALDDYRRSIAVLRGVLRSLAAIA